MFEGILILSGNRDDRRELFDALDGEDLGALYTAKDWAQAGVLIQQGTRIQLVFLDLNLDLTVWERFLGDLTQINGGRKPHVIGVMPAHSTTNTDWVRLPTGVDEVIRSPIQRNEALIRLQQIRSQSSLSLPTADPVLEFLYDGTQDEVYIVDARTHTIRDANPRAVERTGGAIDMVRGRPFHALNLSQGGEEKTAIVRSLQRAGEVEYEFTKAGPRGLRYPVQARLKVGMHQGVMSYIAVLRDNSLQEQLKSLLELLAESLDQFGQAGLERLAEQVAGWLGLDYLAIVEIVEGGERVVLLRHRLDNINVDLAPQMRYGFGRVLRGESVLVADRAFELSTTDMLVTEGRMRSVVGVPLVDSAHRPLGVLMAMSSQVSSHWALRVQGMRLLAHRYATEIEISRLKSDTVESGLRDPLTRLPNRQLFNDRLDTALREAKRGQEHFAVVFIDIDRFKQVNDSFGHAVGDEVLLGVSARIVQAVRASDTVARYAGDEFTVLLRRIHGRDDALVVGAKIAQALELPLTLAKGNELQITASVGIAVYPDDGASSEALLSRADTAMYAAKAMGRNKVSLYSGGEGDRQQQQQRLQLESRLRNAEANNELRVFYQPQVDAVSEDIVGLEALVRWEHPELGLISPGLFIPIAEETGLIVPLGYFVAARAMADVRRWNEQFGLELRIGINLSAVQLKEADLVEQLHAIITRVDIDPRLVEFEVTESIDIREVPNFMACLNGIKGLGVEIAIDDFGTGQASLEYVKRFPADRIKIDQSFVRNIGVDPDDQAIVTATIQMAHKLNRQVIAEGVETEAHLEFLRDHGCEELQGYLFCRPLGEAALEALLAERQRLLTDPRSHA